MGYFDVSITVTSLSLTRHFYHNLILFSYENTVSCFKLTQFVIGHSLGVCCGNVYYHIREFPLHSLFGQMLRVYVKQLCALSHLFHVIRALTLCGLVSLEKLK